MSIVESISGIRGTVHDNDLSPEKIIKYIENYSYKVLPKKGGKVVVGYDGRASGEWIMGVVSRALLNSGVSVIDVGIATTPTISCATSAYKADGAVIVSASHNPVIWNGLKFLDKKGEFLDATEVSKIISKDEVSRFQRKSEAKYVRAKDALDIHIKKILSQKIIDKKSIAKKNLKILVDGINGSGALAMPALLLALGVKRVDLINGEIGKDFAHTPEPLPQNLIDTVKKVKDGKYDMGIVVDPDADRLVFVGEGGKWIGEEYTLVAAVDAFSRMTKSKNIVTVTNLSSSLALSSSLPKGGKVFYAPVGEYNVVQEMKKVKAKIGGEGNGGVIWGDVHYGRDSLVGVALVLSLLTRNDISIGELRDSYKDYFQIKEKINLNKKIDIKKLAKDIKAISSEGKFDTRDGVKIMLDDAWVHIRLSNTEPIMRIYIEAESKDLAEKIFDKYKKILESLL